MSDFFDKANAIWKALDDMAEKSPQEYANFISSQLHEGAALFGNGQDNVKKSKSGGDVGPTNTKTTGDPFGGLLQQFQGITMSSAGPNKKTTKDKSSTAVAENESKPKPRGENETTNPKTKTTLLDDQIGGSLLSSIIKNKGMDDDDDENETELVVQICQSVYEGNKKTSLIQEL